MAPLPDLFPAQVGSPYTKLSAAYTTGESTMSLVDATQLPAAPNIVCLSGAAAGEFSYSGKDGNNLTGVSALSGTPSTTWAIGDYAFRGITAHDLNALQTYADNTPLNKLDGTAAPTANEDSADGYSPGSKWVDVTNDKAYICLDATEGAAVWSLIAQVAGTEGQFILSDGTDPVYADFQSEGVYRNAIINAGMQIAQRGTSFTSATTPANNDDTYLLDQWILLSDGNDIVDVSQVAVGNRKLMKLEVETANKKFGILQILESSTAKQLFEYGSCSLAFKQYGTGLSNIRAAIIAWSSTADSVTSDVVSAWNAAGTDPTLAANWTYENTPANISVEASLTEITISGVTLDTASTANLAVFIWCDDADAQVDETVYLGDVGLNAGSVALPFNPRPYATELALCQRYFKRYSNESSTPLMCIGSVRDATSAFFVLPFAVQMRTPPSLTYSAIGSTHISVTTMAALLTTSALTLFRVSTDGASIQATITGGTLGTPVFLQSQVATEEYLDFDARL